MARTLLAALAAAVFALPADAAELKPVDDAGLAAELNKPGPVFLEVSQTWCGPCKAAAAALHDLMPARPDVRFLTLDAGRSEKLNYLATPTFILYNDGRELARATGYNGPDALRGLLAKLPAARVERAAPRPSRRAELASKFPGMTVDVDAPILAKLEREGYLNRYAVGRPPVTVDRDPVAILETADGPPLLYAPAGVTPDGRRLPEQFYKLVDDGQDRSMEVRSLALMAGGSAYTTTGSYRARKAGAPIAAPVAPTDPFSREARDMMAIKLDKRFDLRFWHDALTGKSYEVADPPAVADTRPWRVRRQTMRPDVPADYGVTPDGKPVMRVADNTWIRLPEAQALYLTASGALKDPKGNVVGRFKPGSSDSGNKLFRGWGTIQGVDGRQYFYYSSGDLEDIGAGTARETLIVKGEPPAA